MTEDEDVKTEVRKHFRPYRDSNDKNTPPDGCWDKEVLFNEVRDFGEVWRNALECNRKTCLKDGTIIEEVCPDVTAPPGCIVIKGLGYEYQDFPYCCDRVACPGDDEFWEEDPRLPERCDDRYCVRDIGEVWTEHKYGLCKRRRCVRNKYNRAEIIKEKCPKLKVPKGCKKEAYPDLTKDFPDCCEKIICPPGHPYNQTVNNNKPAKNAGNETKQNINSNQSGDSGGSDNNKSYGSEAVNQSEREHTNTRWNSYKLSDINEMFKQGAIILFMKERSTHINGELSKSSLNAENTNKSEHKIKHKKKKEKEKRKSTRMSSKEGQKREKLKGRPRTKKKSQIVEDTIIVNASEGENKIDKNESENKSELDVKERAAEKLRRKNRKRKKRDPLSDVHKNENEMAKHTHKSMRNRHKKRRDKEEAKETRGIRDLLNKVIIPPKKYKFV